MKNLSIKTYLLGRNIAKTRKDSNLSQNELAELIDISREHLAKIETGRRNISIPLLFRLCEKLNVQEKDLFDFEQH